MAQIWCWQEEDLHKMIQKATDLANEIFNVDYAYARNFRPLKYKSGRETLTIRFAIESGRFWIEMPKEIFVSQIAWADDTWGIPHNMPFEDKVITRIARMICKDKFNK